jgi:hypothetical protein
MPYTPLLTYHFRCGDAEGLSEALAALVRREGHRRNPDRARQAESD